MKEVSAFICHNPLQMMIVPKIIEEQRISDYVLIHINPHDRPATRNYFAKLARSAVESDYVVANSRIFGNYQKISGVLRRWRRYRIRAIYLAIIDNVWAQHVIHQHPSARIYTFDDGSINLIPSGNFHSKQPLRMRQRIAYFVLRRDKDQDWIKPRIVKHFTIYRDIPNIVEAARVHYIDLFDEYNQLPGEDLEERAKVFVGVDYSPRYLSAVRTVDPDIYLPHPTEKRTESWLNYVSTDLAAEEFVVQLLHRFKSVELYSCNSAVLLNIRSRRIQKVVVDLYGSTSQYQMEFNRLAELMGCNILSFVGSSGEHLLSCSDG